MSNKAQTKFPALAVGQRFVWRGRRFVKTGPLLACAEDDGRSHMIPRSAVVERADAASDATAAASNGLRQALEDLRQAALTHVDALAAGATTPQAARARTEIQAAYQHVLDLIDDKATGLVGD